jgi:acylphosphatase
MPESRAIVRMFVNGRVQGVGFRAFVAREAARRDLTGWVRNRRDGSVETVAAGPRTEIDAFAGVVRRGPWAARVDAFRQEPADEDALRECSGGAGFEVVRDA